MLKATVFEFTSYQFEPEKRRVIFNYKTEFSDGDPIMWTETIFLPKAPVQGPPKKLLEALHLILGISYSKFYCATRVIFPYTLSKQEADFWNVVYKKGLGEFFYKNKLDPKISPKFPFSKSIKTSSCNLEKTGRSLVGIGGGKDSIVSAELLKQAYFNITSFHIETGKSFDLVDNVIKAIGVPQFKIQRFLDRQVHQPHQYNGHIPISAIYAFLGVFACALYKYDSFIVSNEHSSNFGNITYKGLEVNHQWSKSFEFETLFSEYLKNNISTDIKYFSLLRGFYEIRIVKMFAKYKQYFPHFSSCNRNFVIKGATHERLWCGQCAKCVFAFTLLSAFLSKQELLKVFGKNLYDNAILLPLFKDILGLGDMKPFDCVGTFEEARVAFYMATKKFSRSFIVKELHSSIIYNARMSKEVFGVTKKNAIPDQFKFLGAESAYILGYGKEGKVTKQYLKKYYPNIKIGLGDEALDKNYLKKQNKFDIAIKTPGINKALVMIPYTTATNMFFSKVLHKNLIIGVTGSKGKSTTSSLIYHILKVAGKNVELLGNIGKPMLEVLLKSIPAQKIFVLELSSYQLDDIRFSPDIAVVTNLFPEHMDFHGSLENYYAAKKNIIKDAEYFVYNQKSAAWLKGYKGKPVKFSIKKYKSNLIGEHNQNNIGAAVVVAKILKISESKIIKAVKSFKGLSHRLEFVGEFKGINFYDDAISTTPESTIMAIKALKNVHTIFLGGKDRGYDFSQLEKTIRKHKIKNVVLFPDSGDKIIKNKKGLNILQTSMMQEAVRFAYKNTKKGSVCLLSCASPSYSLWENFEVKGDQFKSIVKKLGK